MRKPGVLLPLLVEHFLKKPFNLLYPREDWPLPRGYRGMILWSNEACTGCRVCFTVCSAKAIEMIEDPEKKPLEKGRVRKQIPVFYLDRCMRCSQCEESCPFDAIHLQGGVGLVGYIREKMRAPT
jgi:formate hydrogenlyase subunit 6/NADH:ubiquinone oxidoreductase subunit I